MGIANIVDTVLGACGMVMKKSMSAYNFLETADGETLIAKDGSLATVIRIDGSKKMMGGDELHALVGNANIKLSPYLSRPGHAIQVWFSRDPDLSKDMLKGLMQTPRTVASRLGLDLDDLFAERERIMPQWIVHEQCYMVLWTRMTVLSPQELKKANLDRKTPALWPIAQDSHNLHLVARQVAIRHQSFVSNFMADLGHFGLRVEQLDSHDALRAVKSSIYPDKTDADWRPYLPGDTAADTPRGASALGAVRGALGEARGALEAAADLLDKSPDATLMARAESVGSLTSLVRRKVEEARRCIRASRSSPVLERETASALAAVEAALASVAEAENRLLKVEKRLTKSVRRTDLAETTPGGEFQGWDARHVPWAHNPELGANDLSHLLWPRLDDQLFDQDAEAVNSQIVRVGRYNFAGTDMTIGPQDLTAFSSLLNRMMALSEFPWRVSFLLEGGGLAALTMKNFIAAIAGFSNSDNKLIRDAVKALTAHQKAGGVVVRMRVSFATWAPASNLALIEERINRLQRAVESWGYCQVAPSAGDPVAGVLSSALGLDVRSTAPVGAPPLDEALFMLPWMRDASPFKKGSVLFRTPDRRPWPFQPGSSLQDTFIDIIYAPPGKGKSVYLNTVNLAFCLSPIATSGAGGSQLPRIAIIDIGPSSSGLISLLKESLPLDRRHEADYRRLRMVKEHAINPFDLQLGCRKPLPLDRSFLINLLTLLGTEPGQPTPSGLSQLAGMAIDELYEKFSDNSRRGTPRLYTAGEDAQVDEAIRRWNIDLSEEQTWWGLVDKLFERGANREASLAQRHAVPRVEDLMVIRTPQIMDVFGSALTGNGEPLIDVFTRMVSSTLREYPILTQPTKFDLGESRVVALDLDEAAPRGGGPAEKQTAMVYMLARFVLARDFYLTEHDVNFFPEGYRKFQEKRIRRIRETPKRIVMDEFHRTKAAPAVRDQVRIDMREGRKWGVQVALASQLIEDFDEDMVSLATGFWLMGVNAETDAAKAREVFGLSDTATSVLINDLRGPGRGGAPFLAVLMMKDGKHEHMLVNTLGPMELWAFSTTAEDVGLRGRLYNLLGPGEARKRLSKRFPAGSAKPEIERRVVLRAERGDSGTEASDGVIEELTKELMAMAA